MQYFFILYIFYYSVSYIVNPPFEALSFAFLLQATAREGEDWRAGLS